MHICIPVWSEICNEKKKCFVIIPLDGEMALKKASWEIDNRDVEQQFLRPEAAIAVRVEAKLT